MNDKGERAMENPMEHRTSIRFDMTKESDARAWNYLHDMVPDEYKTLSQAIIAAINYFGEHKGTPVSATIGLDGTQMERVLQDILPNALVLAFQKLVLKDFEVADLPIAPKSAGLAPKAEPEKKMTQAARDFMNSF